MPLRVPLMGDSALPWLYGIANHTVHRRFRTTLRHQRAHSRATVRAGLWAAWWPSTVSRTDLEALVVSTGTGEPTVDPAQVSLDHDRGRAPVRDERVADACPTVPCGPVRRDHFSSASFLPTT